MNTKIVFCILTAFLIVADISYADLFASKKSDLLDISMSSIEDELLAIDFNGDSYLEIVVPKIQDSDFYIALNPKGKDAIADFFLRRGSIVLDDQYIESGMKYIALPSISKWENKESLLLVYPDGRMNVMRCLNDFDVDSDERYMLFPYLLSQLQGGVVLDVALGNVAHSTGKDLLVISSLDDEVSLHIYNDPFAVLKKEETVLSFPTSHWLPGAPTNFWIGSLDGNPWDDIFWEYNNEWYIWLSESSYGGFIGEPVAMPTPPGIKKSVDALPGNDKYPLIVSVETDSDSDVAFMAFPANDLSRPIPVVIPNKHLQGAISRLFVYTNSKTGKSFPLLVVYNSQDPMNPTENVFYIYSVDIKDTINVIQQQILSPEPTMDYAENGYSIYFDRPVIVTDFDSDGISDIVFTAMCAPLAPSINTPVLFRSMGFSGISSETNITDWSVYE